MEIANYQTTVAAASSDHKNNQLRQACREFEALFWHQLLKAMRKSIPSSGLMGNTYQRAVYEDLLDEQYSSLLAEKSASGLGEILYRQLRFSQGESLKNGFLDVTC